MPKLALVSRRRRSLRCFVLAVLLLCAAACGSDASDDSRSQSEFTDAVDAQPGSGVDAATEESTPSTDDMPAVTEPGDAGSVVDDPPADTTQSPTTSQDSGADDSAGSEDSANAGDSADAGDSVGSVGEPGSDDDGRLDPLSPVDAPASDGSTDSDDDPPTVSAPDEPDTPAVPALLPSVTSSQTVARWTVKIVEHVAHDPEAFTQGLEVVGGVMYESTGLWGRSSLRTVDPESGAVLAQVDLADEHFGEGLTVVDDQILQLTWQSGQAIVYDRATLAEIGRHAYAGEGWGLCRMGDELIMSNGSDRLARRHPATFDLIDEVKVTASDYDGRFDYLNELECVDGLVIANVWQSTNLLAIDPVSGRVVAEIDASPLVADVKQAEPQANIDVLNGVAAANDGTATFWMTGKLWPRLYRVQVVETGAL